MNDAERRTFGSGGPWEELYGYARVVRVGRHVHVAGTTAALPQTREDLVAGHSLETTVRSIRRAFASNTGLAAGAAFDTAAAAAGCDSAAAVDGRFIPPACVGASSPGGTLSGGTERAPR